MRIEVATDADLREKGKRAATWVGYQCGDTPLKYRCVKPKDAKTGNLVLLDVRNAGNDKDVLLGEWEGSYQLGTVIRRQICEERPGRTSKDPNKSTEYMLHLVMWEPYFENKSLNYFRPLWVENVIRAKEGTELHPSTWQEVVRLPWRPIKQMPIEHARKLLNNPNFVPGKGELASNFMDSGIDCHKQPKGYRHSQLAGTVRYVSQFDVNERNQNRVDFNKASQRDILVEMSRTEGHDNSDSLYIDN